MKRQISVKRGNSVLTFPFVIMISLGLIIVCAVFAVNMILPFIWYQKLQLASYKYMYIIEKYGYLKENEKHSLIEELGEQGFDKEEIEIKAPTSEQGYGSIIEFSIKYNYKQKLPSWEGSLSMQTRTIPINVNKTIISKV